MKQVFTSRQWIYLAIGATIIFVMVMIANTPGPLLQGFLPSSQSSPDSPPLPSITTTSSQLSSAHTTLPIAPGLVFTVQVQPDGIAQVLGVTPFTKDKRYFPVSVDFPTHRIQVHVGNETFTQEFSAVEVSITEYVDSSGQMHGGMDRKQKMAPFEVIVPLPEGSTVTAKNRVILLDGSEQVYSYEVERISTAENT